MHRNFTSDKKDYVNFGALHHTIPTCSLSFPWTLANLRRFTLADGFLVAETYASIAIDF
jgi:hypothetical protein